MSKNSRSPVILGLVAAGMMLTTWMVMMRWEDIRPPTDRAPQPSAPAEPDGADATPTTSVGAMSMDEQLMAGTVAVPIGQSEAIAIAKESITDLGENLEFPIIEARLMTSGRHRELDGDEFQNPGLITVSESDHLADPVWVVVYSVNKNLAQSGMFGGSAELRDMYLGEAGDAFVWPDGTSRGSFVIDARTGDTMGAAVYSRESTTDFLYDRVLAYPTIHAP